MSLTFWTLWIAVSTGWGLGSLFFVSRAFSRSSIKPVWNPDPAFERLDLISIFKPTPPLSSSQELIFLLPPLESFLCQMTSQHELLLGISKADLPFWQKALDCWKRQFPLAIVRVIHEDSTAHYPNPKINWNYTLSKQAAGKFWLWSDLDITVPPDYLKNLWIEWNETPRGYLTSAYFIPKIETRWGLWDALFVHYEFLPGVILLNQLHRFHTAFGAGILFPAQAIARDDFWDRIGHALADDFQLAQVIGNGRLSRTVVQTTSRASTFTEALFHYLRWHKTIRWCDPLGYAGLIVLLPLLGSLFLSLWLPKALWLTGSIWFIESLIGGILLFKTVEDLRPKHLLPFILWPWLRCFTWLWSWLPTSVRWGGNRWHTPHQSSTKG